MPRYAQAISGTSRRSEEGDWQVACRMPPSRVGQTFCSSVPKPLENRGRSWSWQRWQQLRKISGVSRSSLLWVPAPNFSNGSAESIGVFPVMFLMFNNLSNTLLLVTRVNLAANSSSCESLRQHHSWVDIVVKPISAKTVSSIELTIPVKE